MRKWKKVPAMAICMIEVLIMAGGAAACAGKDNNSMPQQEMRQEETQNDAAQQAAVQPKEIEQNAAQQNEAASGAEQISLEDAKAAALSDAGVSAADIQYTKEKLDYEDGIAVYEIEFYSGNAVYEYEIDAATGTVYGKNIDMHHNEVGHGHHNDEIQTDIGAERAKSIALEHAGFSETDVSRLKCDFDVDDGQTVYEVEFTKDGKEYEYTVSAADGMIIAYEAD